MPIPTTTLPRRRLAAWLGLAAFAVTRPAAAAEDNGKAGLAPHDGPERFHFAEHHVRVGRAPEQVFRLLTTEGQVDRMLGTSREVLSSTVPPGGRVKAGDVIVVRRNGLAVQSTVLTLIENRRFRTRTQVVIDGTVTEGSETVSDFSTFPEPDGATLLVWELMVSDSIIPAARMPQFQANVRRDLERLRGLIEVEGKP